MCKSLILGWDDFFYQSSQRFDTHRISPGRVPPDSQNGFCAPGPVQSLTRGSCSCVRKAGMTDRRKQGVERERSVRATLAIYLIDVWCAGFALFPASVGQMPCILPDTFRTAVA